MKAKPIDDGNVACVFLSSAESTAIGHYIDDPTDVIDPSRINDLAEATARARR